jgi:hypothetical protein
MDAACRNCNGTIDFLGARIHIGFPLPAILYQGVAEPLRLGVGLTGGSAPPHLGHHVGKVARRELQGPVLRRQPAEEVAVREHLFAAAELGQERVVHRPRRRPGAVEPGGWRRHGLELGGRPARLRVEAYEPLLRLRERGEEPVAAADGHGRGGGGAGGRERWRRGGRDGGRRRHGLLLELGVPVVLDVVVGPARELGRDDRPPGSQQQRKDASVVDRHPHTHGRDREHIRTCFRWSCRGSR